MDRTRYPFRRAGAPLMLVAVLVAALALPATTQAAVSRSYTFNGYEVWATSTVGTFVGTARGSAGDLAAWRAAIEHTVEISPTGEITGGYAELRTSDLTLVRGDFAPGGKLRLVSEGSGSCGNLTHEVKGNLVDVVRSDTGAVGTGRLVGTLVHYRTSILGRCVNYSASANGKITLNF
jgi:hypothetical protein